MSVLVFAENNNGSFKKSTYESVHYGHLVAKNLDTKCIAVVIGANDTCDKLGIYGANEVIQFKDISSFDNKVVAKLLADLAESNSAKAIILNHSANGKSLVGRLAVRLDAGSVTGVSNAIKQVEGKYKVSKPVFSGKAIAEYSISSERIVVTLMGNAIQSQEVGEAANVKQESTSIEASGVEILEVKKVSGIVPLPEAELVVSAGRGMKAPENWGIIEELAECLEATTACSRPVADTGWRPHHEHVGQTGVAIRPNLYIAIGISGAIQHLAGVNNSKTIVVINKDSEAPFFKAADYGVCADLFDVVPRLIDAVKKYKETA